MEGTDDKTRGGEVVMFNVNRFVLYVVIVISTICCIYVYGVYQYRQGVSDTKQEQYVAQLEQFKAQTLVLDQVSKQLFDISEQLNEQSKEWKNSYEEVIKKEPLPADCAISPSRVQLINSAIEQATATRKSIVTMPTSGKADKQ